MDFVFNYTSVLMETKNLFLGFFFFFFMQRLSVVCFKQRNSVKKSKKKLMTICLIRL